MSSLDLIAALENGKWLQRRDDPEMPSHVLSLYCYLLDNGAKDYRTTGWGSSLDTAQIALWDVMKHPDHWTVKSDKVS